MQDGKPAVTPQRISQFGFGYAPGLILEAAIENRVFDVLDSGSKTVEEVRAATGASSRGLRILMNALVGLEFLTKDAQEKYALTPESSAFLVSSKPGFHGGILRHTSQILPNWMQLKEIVRTGRPARAANQESQGATFFHDFVEALFPMGYPNAKILADHLQIAQVKSAIKVLDLAAGSGVWGIAIAQASPQVQVTAIDWAGVIPVTRKVVHQHGLDKRFVFIEGDLLQVDFQSGYQIAILGHILHTEGSERSKKLLQKTFAALAPGGTIAIAEWLVNSSRSGPVNGLIFAVNMLVNSEEGDTFSFEEIGGWLRQVGFTDPRTLDVPGPSPLILATKPTPKTKK